MKKKKGVIYKGYFCPLWGGMALFNSESYYHGGMDGVSPTIRAEKNDAGVVVLYED